MVWYANNISYSIHLRSLSVQLLVGPPVCMYVRPFASHFKDCKYFRWFRSPNEMTKVIKEHKTTQRTLSKTTMHPPFIEPTTQWQKFSGTDVRTGNGTVVGIVGASVRPSAPNKTDNLRGVGGDIGIMWLKRISAILSSCAKAFFLMQNDIDYPSHGRS